MPTIELFNEDCMVVMERYPDKHFDLAIVDPPYGIGADNHAGKKENGWIQWEKKDWDIEPPGIEYFIELKRVSKNQIVWGGNYMADKLQASQCWLCWNKMQRGFSLADVELAWTSFNKAMRIFDMSRGEALGKATSKIHPTQKPVKLYEWLLMNFSKKGEKILDTHLGSGSSAIAAYYFGVDFVGCELDVDYYDAGRKRVERETAQTTLFEL